MARSLDVKSFGSESKASRIAREVARFCRDLGGKPSVEDVHYGVRVRCSFPNPTYVVVSSGILGVFLYSKNREHPVASLGTFDLVHIGASADRGTIQLASITQGGASYGNIVESKIDTYTNRLMVFVTGDGRRIFIYV